MQIFNFIVLSVIIVNRSVLSPHISKGHLPISSLNVHELELNWCSKDQSSKMGEPPAWGEREVAGSPTLLQNLEIY